MNKNEIRINTLTKEFDKCMKSVERNTKLLEKKTVIAEKFGVNVDSETWYQIRSSMDNKQMYARIELEIAKDNTEEATRKLTRTTKELNKVEIEILKEQEANTEIEQNKILVVEEFLDKWLEGAIKAYEAAGLLVTEDEGDLNTVTLEDLVNERNRKSKYIAYRTYKFIGKITDAGYLIIGVDGNLNGVLKGEKGEAHIQSIIAGGYNIQCRHIRMLINLI